MSTQIEGMSQVFADDDADDVLTEAEKSMREEELSFYSNSENEFGDDNIWGLLSGVGGNIYEWYDFAVYGLLAPEIGAAFFPSASRELQLINSFGVNFSAFLMRPLGAIFFGEIGDRLVGRKNAMVFSILLITVPSIMMGLLPGYDAWGTAAPVILVLLRMTQGLSVGGQLAGSYVLSIEQSSSRTRGFRGAVCDASSVGGFLLASAVTTVCRSILSEDQINDWGWRVPFLFSLILAPILYYIVSNAEESKLWTEKTEEKETEDIVEEKGHGSTSPAVVDLLSSPFRRRQLMGMIGVLSAVTSSFYMLFLWTPVYLSELRGIMKEKDADLINFFVIGMQIFFIMMAGKLSDYFPHRMDLVRIGLPGIIVACPTMFAMFECESWVGIVLAQLLFGFSLSLVQGSMASWEVELWMADPTMSFTGVAIGHNMASTLFGGTMPLVATFLYYRANDIIANNVQEAGMEDAEDYALQAYNYNFLWPRLLPGLYISCLGCLSFYCITYVVRHPHDVRIGGNRLKQAVVEQEYKVKTATKSKKKRKQQLAKALESGDFAQHQDSEDAGAYEPPTVSTN
mmetsp:Transcript_855/g.1134  ORF Transcript_855/g.1134 Transcript_855/m.1134 type:complete len:570 (+) Transcript_855:264-1973(+)|eukprot:CAMPEP_0198138734 /NCGR_PEP_ID=MMETSP1443-20131203/2137_1 /TAXON_ID=186043 /ORGANISM="Entomoneis sp., Strain CCMP2396" /LENGTH=569 /DNA_ID=CAMNT_0043800643 /DNA_START=337 /DNA_END=2046 /DNA_ORIENTATION=-